MPDAYAADGFRYSALVQTLVISLAARHVIEPQRSCKMYIINAYGRTCNFDHVGQLEADCCRCCDSGSFGTWTHARNGCSSCYSCSPRTPQTPMLPVSACGCILSLAFLPSLSVVLANGSRYPSPSPSPGLLATWGTEAAVVTPSGLISLSGPRVVSHLVWYMCFRWRTLA